MQEMYIRSSLGKLKVVICNIYVKSTWEVVIDSSERFCASLAQRQLHRTNHFPFTI
jgi:hypothetical protein